MTGELAPNGKPKVTVKEIGYGENAFLILGRAFNAMKKAGWTQEEREAFKKAATHGDYYELLNTVEQYVREEDEETVEEFAE